MKPRGALRQAILTAIRRNATAGASLDWLACVTGSTVATVAVVLHRLRTHGLVVTADERHFIAGIGIAPDAPYVNDNNWEAA